MDEGLEALWDREAGFALIYATDAFFRRFPRADLMIRAGEGEWRWAGTLDGESPWLLARLEAAARVEIQARPRLKPGAAKAISLELRANLALGGAIDPEAQLRLAAFGRSLKKGHAVVSVPTRGERISAALVTAAIGELLADDGVWPEGFADRRPDALALQAFLAQGQARGPLRDQESTPAGPLLQIMRQSRPAPQELASLTASEDLIFERFALRVIHRDQNHRFSALRIGYWDRPRRRTEPDFWRQGPMLAGEEADGHELDFSNFADLPGFAVGDALVAAVSHGTLEAILQAPADASLSRPISIRGRALALKLEAPKRLKAELLDATRDSSFLSLKKNLEEANWIGPPAADDAQNVWMSQETLAFHKASPSDVFLSASVLHACGLWLALQKKTMAARPPPPEWFADIDPEGFLKDPEMSLYLARHPELLARIDPAKDPGRGAPLAQRLLQSAAREEGGELTPDKDEWSGDAEKVYQFHREALDYDPPAWAEPRLVEALFTGERRLVARAAEFQTLMYDWEWGQERRRPLERH